MRICTRLYRGLMHLGFAQFLIFAQSVGAQLVSNDYVVYTTFSGWEDMRACARCPFQIDFRVCGVGDDLNNALGCMTNACLCRPSTLEEAAEFLDDKVISLCSNSDDQTTATEFLLRYCSAHGYTSVGTATSSTVSSETPETQSSLHESQETPSTSQNHASFTSDSSPSQTSTAFPPITSAPSMASTTENSSPTNAAGSETEPGDDKLKTTDIIGIVVGLLSLFIAILTLWVSWKTGRPKRLWGGVTSQSHVVQMRQS
ncbi:hypothetical protein F5Y12DRAFT_195759 [Xylaria sp. FL1777]|nr:hypothetical protein F5Y12DRAFT_195759 [Xylaria sp. FL1777]